MSRPLETLGELITEVRTEAMTAEIALAVGAVCAAVTAASTLIPHWGRWRGDPILARRWAVARIVALGAAMALFAAQVRASGWLTGADTAAFDWTLTHRHPALTTIAVAVTDLGGPVGVAIAATVGAIILGWRYRHPLAAVALPGVIATALTASTLTKLLVARDRPPIAARLVTENNYSFPSGHVTAITALAGTVLLLYLHRRPGRAAAAIATTLAVTAVVLIAGTRLYLGVHWLSDLAGGALLGATVVCAAALPARYSATTRAWLTGHRASSQPPTADTQHEHVTVKPDAPSSPRNRNPLENKGVAS